MLIKQFLCCYSEHASAAAFLQESPSRDQLVGIVNIKAFMFSDIQICDFCLFQIGPYN